jgi:hypothetical protein
VLWIGSAAGSASLASDHIDARDAAEPLHQQIFGVVEDSSGCFWIATSNHLLRVKRDRLLGCGSSAADVREYGLADGLLGTEGVKRHQTVVVYPLGRIWFSGMLLPKFLGPALSRPSCRHYRS